jgi:ABC-type multidrug transport system ATPase subunit
VYAGLYCVANADNKIKELTAHLDLSPLLNKQYKDLSAGQKTRVNIAKSLLNDPALLLMDEPTASLDPDIADRVLTFIERIKKERDISLLFTSHNMDEVARICDRVIFLDKGSIVAEDTPVGLTKRVKYAQLRLTFDGSRKPIQTYASEQGLEVEFPRRQVVTCSVEEPQIPKVIFGLSKVGVYMTDIDIKKPDLEDVFLDIARGGEG